MPDLPSALLNPGARRDVLIRRVFGAVAAGRSLTAIARRRSMPRARTFRRWLAADPRQRQSYDTALMVQTHVMQAENNGPKGNTRPPPSSVDR